MISPRLAFVFGFALGALLALNPLVLVWVLSFGIKRDNPNRLGKNHRKS